MWPRYAYCTSPGVVAAPRHQQARHRTATVHPISANAIVPPAFAGAPIRASTITSCVHTHRVEGRCDLSHRAVAWPGEAGVSSLTGHGLLPNRPPAGGSVL